MRLIDSEPLVEDFEGLASSLENARCFSAADAIQGAAEKLRNAPTVDAEPVVRCNTCKHYETDTGFCNYHGHGMHWDDYCSRGAKMDEEVQR